MGDEELAYDQQQCNSLRQEYDTLNDQLYQKNQYVKQWGDRSTQLGLDRYAAEQALAQCNTDQIAASAAAQADPDDSWKAAAAAAAATAYSTADANLKKIRADSEAADKNYLDLQDEASKLHNSKLWKVDAMKAAGCPNVPSPTYGSDMV